MSKSVIVLGGGLVGKHIAMELSKTHSVVCVDPQPIDFNGSTVHQICTALNSHNVVDYVNGYDLVVGALPGNLAFDILQEVVREGIDLVDISFMEEDPTPLIQTAKQNGSKAVFDIGVAPGLCGVWIGREYEEQGGLETALIEVGGLPIEPKAPHYYRAPFEPMGVIAEYTRPARLREYGKDVVKAPFSEVSHYPLLKISGLYSFNTDGLRTLLTSFPDVPNMVEKTVRDIEHIEQMVTLQNLGFFQPHALHSTAQVLIDGWKYQPGEEDFTTMRVVCKGKKHVEYTLYDEYTNGIPSMARTTGYTACAVAEMVLGGTKVDNLPEEIGKYQSQVEHIENYLLERGIRLTKEEIDDKVSMR